MLDSNPQSNPTPPDAAPFPSLEPRCGPSSGPAPRRRDPRAIASPIGASAISDGDYSRFQALIHDIAGIRFSEGKKTLLCGRLAKRLRERGLSCYGEYFRLITSAGEQRELSQCVDLLTTNETYFYREPRHFQYLSAHVLPRFAGSSMEIWSAACSTGEEAYTLGMVAAEGLGPERFNILASDLSTRALEHAAAARYPVERVRNLPQSLLRRYCLKGVGSQAGSILVDAPVRSRVRLAQVNLNKPLPAIGPFDLIFLRNVMIYFDVEVKRAVLARVLQQLRPGGWLFIGHSESLNGICREVEPVAPTIYRKAGAGR